MLGIDPGLVTCGYGMIVAVGMDARLVEGGAIRPPDRRATLEQRLVAIFNDMTGLLKEMRPDVVAVEDLYTRYERPRTAILMGHARGVITLACGLAEVPVRTFAANTVKRAMTGEGRATKEDVQHAVASILSLKVLPEPADVADALAIALTCAYSLRLPVGVHA